jgi:hypothetical protein
MEAALGLIAKAKDARTEVIGNFNGIEISGHPVSHADIIVEYYERERRTKGCKVSRDTIE